MELATVTIKLSGQANNTVIKEKITPAQLSVYMAMHGDDCVQKIVVTSIDKDRKNKSEVDRLRAEFSTDHAAKNFSRLYPGANPTLPVTFSSIGIDTEVDTDPGEGVHVNVPEPKNRSEEKIFNKINNNQSPPPPPPQSDDDDEDPEDNSEEDDLMDDEGMTHFSDDPIDVEVNKLNGEN